MDSTDVAKQDFLAQLLENMQEQLNRLEKKTDKQSDTLAKNTEKLKAIEEQTKKTNGRVTKLETERGRTQINPKLLYFIIAGTFVALLIVAKLLGVQVGGLTP